MSATGADATKLKPCGVTRKELIELLEKHHNSVLYSNFFFKAKEGIPGLFEECTEAMLKHPLLDRCQQCGRTIAEHLPTTADSSGLKPCDRTQDELDFLLEKHYNTDLFSRYFFVPSKGIPEQLKKHADIIRLNGDLDCCKVCGCTIAQHLPAGHQVMKPAEFPPVIPQIDVSKFRQLLASRHISRAKDDVISRILMHFPRQLQLVGGDAGAALSLYDMVKNLPATTTRAHVADEYKLHLNGYFAGNANLILGCRTSGEMVMIKMDVDSCEEEVAVTVVRGVSGAVQSESIVMPRDTFPKRCLVMPLFATTVDHLPKLPTNLICRGIKAVGSVLNLLHEKGYAHMDVKPSNIFVDWNGDWHLGDFGSVVKFGTQSRGCTDFYLPSPLEVKVTATTDWEMLLTLVALVINAVYVSDQSLSAIFDGRPTLEQRNASLSTKCEVLIVLIKKIRAAIAEEAIVIDFGDEDRGEHI